MHALYGTPTKHGTPFPRQKHTTNKANPKKNHGSPLAGQIPGSIKTGALRGVTESLAASSPARATDCMSAAQATNPRTSRARRGTLEHLGRCPAVEGDEILVGYVETTTED